MHLTVEDLLFSFDQNERETVWKTFKCQDPLLVFLFKGIVIN